MKSQLSPTWILFASGNSVKVELSLYDPAAERSRPIEAYMVSDVGSDLARSASRAAEAIYAIAHTAKIAPPPTVVGYDLQGLGSGSRIAGHSSGLALALALAKKFWPDSDPGPIAATGEIAGSSNGGPLHKIAEIEAKAQTVISLLPEGGYFFYPKGNDPEISETLKQLWRERGIKARAVGSVAEALATFVPAITDQTTLKPELAASIAMPEAGRRPAPLLFIALALTAVIAVAGLLYTNYISPIVPPVKEAKEISSPIVKVDPVAQKIDPGVLQPPVKKVVAPVSKPNQLPPQTMPKKAKISPATPTPPAVTTAKPTESTPVTRDFPEITLTGTSGLAGRLARRTRARLKAFIDSDKNLQKELQSVDGRIEIIEIRERWNAETDSLSSTVTAAFHGQAALKNGDLSKINLAPLTVSGNGPMRQQLTHAATLMVERIANTLRGGENIELREKPASVIPETKTSKGFE